MPERRPRGFIDRTGVDGYHALVPMPRYPWVGAAAVLAVLGAWAIADRGHGVGTTLALCAAVILAVMFGTLRRVPEVLAMLPLPISVAIDPHRLHVRRGPLVIDVELDAVCEVRARRPRASRASALIVDCGDRGEITLPLGLPPSELTYLVRRIEEARALRGFAPNLGYRGVTSPQIRVAAEPEPAEPLLAEEDDELDATRARSMRRG